MMLSIVNMKANACLTSLASVILAVLTVTPLAVANVAYKITVETGTLNNAGTDENVFITLGSGPVPTNSGGCDEFSEQPLKARGLGDFERGQTDIFRISDRDLVDLPWICLRHEQQGEKPGWFVNTVTVQREDTSQRWRFLVFRWLALDEPPDFSIRVVAPREEPLNRSVDTVILPYQASNYLFKTSPDSSFSVGNAAFGSGGGCPLQSTVQTNWPINSELLISRVVSIPHEATNVRIMASVDNDILEAFFNKELLASDVMHDGCSILDEFRFDPQFIRPGSNIVSFHLRDRGVESFFDTSIRAELPVLPSLPKTSECPFYKGFGAPACPWELVPLTPDDPSSWFDDNNFLLNPQWQWQHLAAAGGLLGVGVPEVYTPRGSGLSAIESSQITGADHSFYCTGHLNLLEVTYTGKLRWVGHDHPLGDDDYNILIFGPRVSDPTGLIDFVAGGTLHNHDSIKGEFNAGETIDNFDKSPWWNKFHSEVDKQGISSPGDFIDGHDAVMTGLMGFDVFHAPASEIHPVHALAIRMDETPNPADDAWAVFVRNWGNEGFCGHSQHYVQRHGTSTPMDTQISIRIPHPPGMAAARFAPSNGIFRSLNAPTGYKLDMAPDGDAVVTFLLNVPTEQSYKFGEVHLVWAPPTGASFVAQATTPVKTVQPVAQGARALFNSPSSANDEEEGPEESAERRAVYNALSAEEQEAIKARIAAALPRRPDDVELDTETVVAGSLEPLSEGQIVFTAPEQHTQQILDVGLAALCSVTGGVTPQAPLLCQASDIVTPFVTLFPLRSTFKTTAETAGCPPGFVGQFSFTARLANGRGSPSLSDLRVRIATLTSGNLLQNADGQAGGEGSTLTVPQEGALSDGVLSPAESVDVPFIICLIKKPPFYGIKAPVRFFVDVLGAAH